MNSAPYIILGGGGHANVVADLLLACSKEILGYVAPDPAGGILSRFPRLSSEDSHVLTFSSQSVCLANGLGWIGVGNKRQEVFLFLQQRGYQFPALVHPSAVVGRDVTLHQGVQVMAGSIVQTGCVIEENTLINTRAAIDHHCLVGAHSHLAPGVTVSGDVTIGNQVFIGAGATVINGVTIKGNSFIGAGTVVTDDVAVNSRVLGFPRQKK